MIPLPVIVFNANNYLKDQTIKIGSMADQKYLERLAQGLNKIILKETTRYFLFILTNYQRIRNQPTFAYAEIFGHKNKILTMYDSPSVYI